MIMQELNSKYTWLNPYTGITKTGIVVDIDHKNEMMTILCSDKIYHIGS